MGTPSPAGRVRGTRRERGRGKPGPSGRRSPLRARVARVRGALPSGSDRPAARRADAELRGARSTARLPRPPDPSGPRSRVSTRSSQTGPGWRTWSWSESGSLRTTSRWRAGASRARSASCWSRSGDTFQRPGPRRSRARALEFAQTSLVRLRVAARGGIDGEDAAAGASDLGDLPVDRTDGRLGRRASDTRSPTPTVCALRASSGTWYARPAGVSTTA